MVYGISFMHQTSCFLRSDWHHSVKSNYDKTSSERKAEMYTDRHVWMSKSPLRDDAILLRCLSYLLKVLLGLSVHHFRPGIYHCSWTNATKQCLIYVYYLTLFIYWTFLLFLLTWKAWERDTLVRKKCANCIEFCCSMLQTLQVYF